LNYIENIAAIDCKNGNHSDCGENSMLIQISDICGWVPEPKFNFKEVHKFEFLDIEENDKLAEYGITNKQAQEIVDLLKHALDNRMNVVVHCVAGICRSGAVVEVAKMMGFNDCENYRQPNIMVKSKMMKALGWGYK